MNLIQEILKASGGSVVKQLGDQFGLDSKQAESALSNLIPAIAAGVKKSASSKSGLEDLLGKVGASNELQNAIDLPELLAKAGATSAGNEILGNIFGSKEVSRDVAGQVSKSTGVDSGVLKKMLPLVAGLVMSSLNKRGQAESSGGGRPRPPRGGGRGLPAEDASQALRAHAEQSGR